MANLGGSRIWAKIQGEFGAYVDNRFFQTSLSDVLTTFI